MDNLGYDMKKEKLKVVFMGGKQAGCIGLLSLLAAGCEIITVVVYDELIETLAEKLDLKKNDSIKEEKVKKILSKSDILVSVHGREIVPKDLFELPKLGGINVHPCLYKYKGKNPIERLLEEGVTKASIGIHYMAEDVDSGEVIIEREVDVSGKKSVEEVYNQLYPYYAFSIIEAIDKLRKEN